MKYTENRARLYEYIKTEIETKGYPPSIREMCKGTGIKSTATIHRMLDELAADQKIIKEDGKPRAIRLAEESGTGQETAQLTEENRVLAEWLAQILVSFGDEEFKSLQDLKENLSVVNVSAQETETIRKMARDFAMESRTRQKEKLLHQNCQ